ncbi:hypothetical protein PENSPDRAFT_682710 [Peniophora sp. CONT]|nr:hypothetical protein PENSPDRAFT_682710 [Peniophora sp. CONT]
MDTGFLLVSAQSRHFASAATIPSFADLVGTPSGNDQLLAASHCMRFASAATMAVPRSTMDFGDMLRQFPLPPSSNMSLDEPAAIARIPGASSQELLAIIELLDRAEDDVPAISREATAKWVDSVPPSPIEPAPPIYPIEVAIQSNSRVIVQAEPEVDLSDFVVIGRRDLPPVERWTLVDKVRVPVRYVVVKGGENAVDGPVEETSDYSLPIHWVAALGSGFWTTAHATLGFHGDLHHIAADVGSFKYYCGPLVLPYKCSGSPTSFFLHIQSARCDILLAHELQRARLRTAFFHSAAAGSGPGFMDLKARAKGPGARGDTYIPEQGLAGPWLSLTSRTPPQIQHQSLHICMLAAGSTNMSDSAPARALPPLDDTLGALYIGVLVSALLYGVSFLQTAYYLFSARGDSLGLKLLVGVICALDTVHQGMITHAAYIYLVTNFMNPNMLDAVVWTLIAEVVINALLALFVQLFFVWRIYTLSDKRFWLTAPLAVLSIAKFCMAVLWVGIGTHMHTWVDLLKLEDISQAITVITLVTDGSIAAALIFLLYASRSGSKCLSSLELMKYTMNTGVLTGIDTLCLVITYAARPNTLISIAFFFVLGRLYSNSLLATLNARASRSSLQTMVFGMNPHLNSGIVLSDVTADYKVDNLVSLPLHVLISLAQIEHIETMRYADRSTEEFLDIEIGMVSDESFH